MMDYFCAILLVLFSLFALVIRLFQNQYRWVCGVVGAAILSFYVYHVHYLASRPFDYGYNMTANVTAGLINGFGWLLWSFKVRRRQPYVWKGAISVVAVFLMLLLEVLDFPPIWWSFDAHALWHAGTSPIPILWYRFLVDDCTFLADYSQKNKLA